MSFHEIRWYREVTSSYVGRGFFIFLKEEEDVTKEVQCIRNRKKNQFLLV